MSGRYTEVFTRTTCPECRKANRQTPTMYYVSDEGDLTLVQERCTDRRSCGWVQTRATATGIEVRRTLLQARSRARVFATIALGELLALSAIAIAASALAAR